MEVATKKRIKKICLIILAVLLSLILLLTGTFFYMQYRGKSQFHDEDSNISVVNDDISVDEDEDIVMYKDEPYKLNEDVVSILVIGIDKESIDVNEGFGDNGQADSLFVATVNTATKKIKVIPIPRETMVDVNIYSKSGVFIETKREQLCLAYAYGNTPESSAQNVLRSVRRTMYGINISSYVTVDMQCVSVLSNAVGGVKVTCLETLKDSPFIEGKQMTVKGENAIKYIRLREDGELGSSKRLKRQKQFLSAFLSTAGNQLMNDFSLLTTFYN
ncbi:MAG: LCP family protein, partial [Clostridia bacterium]|nr:LCP family protein [Clostridia bacterium]